MQFSATLLFLLIQALSGFPIWIRVSITSAKDANRHRAKELGDSKREFADSRRANGHAVTAKSRVIKRAAKIAESLATFDDELRAPVPIPAADFAVALELVPTPPYICGSVISSLARQFGAVSLPLPEVVKEFVHAHKAFKPAARKTLPPPAVSVAPRQPLINWELLMGVRLFAWIGGFALFLPVAFFVKYSLEHDLIPPDLCVATGYLVCVGLVVGSLWFARSRYADHGADDMRGVCGEWVCDYFCPSWGL